MVMENNQKIQALKALDTAMDSMMIDYAQKFAKNPQIGDLEILYKLIDIDTYVDHYLEKSGEKPSNMYTGMNQAMSGATNQNSQGLQNTNDQTGSLKR